MKKNLYPRFLFMIMTSMVVMFCLNYLTTYEVSHVYWSDTRFFMVLIMGAAMNMVMLLFMLEMYQNKAANLMMMAGSFVLALFSLYLVRSQITINDSSWMRAMIPHHSIAILTSQRAQIKDVRARKLADGIIKTQRKEIKEMQWLLDDIKKNGIISDQSSLPDREVPDFTE